MNTVPLLVVLFILAGVIAWYNISNHRRKEKERLTPEVFFPENYIPSEGRGTDVNATFNRLLAYARTKGCIRDNQPNENGYGYLYWPDPEDVNSFQEIKARCASGGSNSLQVHIWPDMTIEEEVAVVEKIDQLNWALDKAAKYWFRHNHPDLHYRNTVTAGIQTSWVKFNVQAGRYAHNRLNIEFIAEVIRRRDLLQQAEDQRIAEARRQAAEDVRGIALDQ